MLYLHAVYISFTCSEEYKFSPFRYFVLKPLRPSSYICTQVHVVRSSPVINATDMLLVRLLSKEESRKLAELHVLSKAITIRLLVSHLPPASFGNPRKKTSLTSLFPPAWLAFEGCAVFSAVIVSG